MGSKCKPELIKKMVKENFFVCSECCEKDKKAIGCDALFDSQFVSECDICGELKAVAYCPKYPKRGKLWKQKKMMTV